MTASSTLVGLAEVRAAQSALAGVVRRTPLVCASSDPSLGHLWLKCENLQVIGAFKARGAFRLMSRLPAAALARGAITYSSGNHGQAVAWAARRLGVPAVVVMPTTAPAIKVAGARALGADVVFAGTTTLDRKAEAERLARGRGLVMVPPFDHPDVIAGQGTTGLEIIEDRPDVTAIYVPVGGGGLISGVAVAVRAMAPHVRIVGAEPAGAPKMTRSLRAGEPVTLEHVASLADGLLAVRPGDLTFAHVRALVDEVVQVDEDEIVEAVRFLASDAKLVAEPSGAVSVAAARRLAPAGSPGTHVAVVSGGNIAGETLAGLLGAAEPRRSGHQGG